MTSISSSLSLGSSHESHEEVQSKEKFTHSLDLSSKCALVAFAVVGIAGTVIVILGSLQLFGTPHSIGFVASITTGGSAVVLAMSGVVMILYQSRPEPVSYTSKTSSSSTDSSSATQSVEVNGDLSSIDHKVAILTDSYFTKHLTGKGHPERPDRIQCINRALEQAGFMNKGSSASPRMATMDELMLCHDADYIAKVEQEIGSLKVDEIANLSTGDVKISKHSLKAARLAVGAVFNAVDQVIAGESSSAYCVVRPPGHHAGCARGAGFCIFNNVALAARYAQYQYNIRRVLIVDWDVHHGDGTQAIFYDDPSVFYFSTHEDGNYPKTGKATETGKGKGKGFTLNVPIEGKRLLNSREGTGAQVIEAFQNELTEAMNDFQPELVLISAGFDGHKDDPLGGFDLTNEDFATLTRCVKQIADTHAQGRIVSVLEGGYHLDAIAAASVAHVRALMDD